MKLGFQTLLGEISFAIGSRQVYFVFLHAMFYRLEGGGVEKTIKTAPQQHVMIT